MSYGLVRTNEVEVKQARAKGKMGYKVILVKDGVGRSNIGNLTCRYEFRKGWNTFCREGLNSIVVYKTPEIAQETIRRLSEKYPDDAPFYRIVPVANLAVGVVKDSCQGTPAVWTSKIAVLEDGATW